MNRRTRTSTRWITASALALALPLLAACTSDTDPSNSPSESASPTQSETATPTETERDPLTPPTFDEPTSEEQAAEDAKAAVIAYNESQVEIESSHAETALELFLAGEALAEAEESLQNIIEFDLEVSGNVAFAPNDAVTVSSKSTDFDTASVTGCVDLNNYEVLQDGEKLEVPGNGKHPRIYDLAYNASTHTWKILSTYQMEGTC